MWFVSGYLISAKTIPYISFMWYEVSKNGTKLKWNEMEVVRSLGHLFVKKTPLENHVYKL